MAKSVKNPKRVIARKTKNYKSVHRPMRWGNPFPVKEYGREESLRLYEKWLDKKLQEDPHFLEPLRGYNLGCFCPLDVACHADVILHWLEQHEDDQLERLLESYVGDYGKD